MAVFSSGASLRRRWFLTLSLVAAVGVIAVGVILWQAVGLSSLSTVSDHVAAAMPFAGAIRFALIGVLALAWPRLPALWAGAKVNDHCTHARWMAVRWRVVGWLLVIEFVLGQNIVLGAQCDARRAPAGAAPGMAQIHLIGRFLGALAGAVA